MPELQRLAATCNQIATANGFDMPNWDNIVIKLALVGTELHEGRDNVYGLAADPLAEELADAAIRTLGILGSIWGDDWSDRVTGRGAHAVNPFAPIEVLLWPTLGYTFKAMEARRRDDKTEARMCLELALLELFRLSDALVIDLSAQILAKCEKNRTRAHLHGKAYAVG